MKRFYVLYRWYKGDHWHLYNKRDGGFNRKELKKILGDLKEMGAETKVLTEPLLNLLKK